MMLVDGSPVGDTTVWQETVSVLAGTDYTFSAWAMPSDAANLSTLRFFINSAQIGSDLSLVTPSGTWQNFTNGWNAGANTSATIRIVDTNTQGFGNDFALDDVSFTGSNVPEPSAAILLLSGAAICLRRRSLRTHDRNA